MNVNSIDKIKNDSVRKIIVETYVLMKGMIDTFRLNNQFIEQRKQLHISYKTIENEHYKEPLAELDSYMRPHAKYIVEQFQKPEDKVTLFQSEKTQYLEAVYQSMAKKNPILC